MAGSPKWLDDLIEATYRYAAEVSGIPPEVIPSRTFIDDLGRRWEWCGGEPGTWAWRVTALPDEMGWIDAL